MNVSSPYAISRCTARETRHVNRHKYHFALFFFLPCFVRKGPPKSTAHLEKIRNGNANRIWGSRDMICPAALALRILHDLHSFSTCRIYLSPASKTL